MIRRLPFRVMKTLLRMIGSGHRPPFSGSMHSRTGMTFSENRAPLFRVMP